MNLICSCCIGIAPSKKQWWNQDTGYGICASCFQRVLEHEVRVLGPTEGREHAEKGYGIPGIHHSVNQLTPNQL